MRSNWPGVLNRRARRKCEMDMRSVGSVLSCPRVRLVAGSGVGEHGATAWYASFPPAADTCGDPETVPRRPGQPDDGRECPTLR